MKCKLCKYWGDEESSIFVATDDNFLVLQNIRPCSNSEYVRFYTQEGYCCRSKYLENLSTEIRRENAV